MKIGYFTSIRGWGGSEMYLLGLMQGVRERGNEVLLFGVAGTRLWDEAGLAGIPRVAWRKVESRKSKVEIESEVGGRRTEDGLSGIALAKTEGRKGDIGSLPTYSHTHLPTHVSHSLRSMVYSLKSFSHSLQSRLKRLALACVPSGIKLLAGNLREILHLRRLFRAHPVDVMHVNVHGYEMAGTACRLVNIPSVGVYCIVPDAGEKRLRRLLIYYTGKAYHHIVGKSCFATNLWQKELKRVPSVFSSVYNGVDLRNFMPSYEKKDRSSCFHIVSVGRLDKTKRFDVLVNIIGQIKDFDVSLTIVGDGPEFLYLKQLAQEHDVLKKIVFSSYQDDVRPLLQQADVFCYPSEYDSFGQVLIEAMACGLPLVTSDYGPFSEINIDGETGFVVPVGDVNAFVEKLKQLNADADLRNRFSITARSRAEQCFDNKSCIAKTIEVYKQVFQEAKVPIHE